MFADLSEELNLLPSELANFEASDDDYFDDDDVGNDNNAAEDNGDEDDDNDAVDDEELEEDEAEQLKRIFDEYEPGKDSL